MAEEDQCIAHVLAASQIENEAMELDRAGDSAAAVRKYEQCAAELGAAIAAALPDHAEDQPKLAQHRSEILDRVAHLKSMRGKPASIPVEDQIRAVQLGMQASSAATAAVGSAGGVKTFAACAALGAGAGFMVLGGAIGVVGGAVAAGYMATRGDKAGDAARAAGGAGLTAASKAKELNDKHQVAQKATELGKQAFSSAKAADAKYGISTKIGQGVGAAMSKAKDIEQKHHVTDKVAGGISTGLGKLTSALSRPSSASGSAAGAASAHQS